MRHSTFLRRQKWPFPHSWERQILGTLRGHSSHKLDVIRNFEFTFDAMDGRMFVQLTFTALSQGIFDFLTADVTEFAFDKRSIRPNVRNGVLSR